MKGKFGRLCAKCMGKLSEAVVDSVLETLIPFVATWCWNQTRVQEMRKNFAGLLQRIRWLNRTTDKSNPAVNQLLRQLENEASEGIELLDGELTPLKLQNAMKRFEKIRTITQDLKQLLKMNATTQSSNAGLLVVKIKPPQFKPLYLCRRTRFQVLTG